MTESEGAPEAVHELDPYSLEHASEPQQMNQQRVCYQPPLNSR